MKVGEYYIVTKSFISYHGTSYLENSVVQVHSIYAGNYSHSGTYYSTGVYVYYGNYIGAIQKEEFDYLRQLTDYEYNIYDILN